MLKKYFAKTNLGIIFFFTAFLVYGLWAFNDYGISLDEHTERSTGLINYKFVFPEDAQGQKGTVNFSELPDLFEWRDLYYGVSAQYIPILVERVFGFTMEMHRVFQIRHLFTFLLFWAASICFYFLCRMLGESKAASFAGAVFLILSPRILADSFYNIKDSVFLSLTVYNLCAACLFLRKQGWLQGLLLAVVSAVCINVRVLGGEILFLCLVMMLIKGAREKKFLKAGGMCLLVGLSSLIFYILITPVTWPDIVGAVIGILKTFSDYTQWTGYNYYNGEALRGWELPWHYIPVWIVTTTPICYTLLAVIGAIRWKFVGKERWQEKWLVFLYAVIPLLYAVIRKPTLYNGWRHFYFVYPGILAFSVHGWQQLRDWLKNRQYGRRALLAATAIHAVWMGGWILKNHPFECVYFTPPFREYATANLEKDYWHLAKDNALKWIGTNDPRESITVSGGSLSYLPEGTIKDRLSYADWYLADYIVYSNISGDVAERFDDLYLKELRGIKPFRFDGFDLCDEVYSVQVDGVKICTVYRHTHNKIEGAMLKYEEGRWSYDLNGVDWKEVTNEEATDNMICLEGSMREVLWADRIGVQADQEMLPERIALSLDGETWTEYTPEDWQKIGGKRLQLNFEGREIQRIRLYYAEEKLQKPENTCFDLNVGFYYEDSSAQRWLDRPEGIESVSTPENVWVQQQAIDGDENTRWDSGRAQYPGLMYELVLEDICQLGGITLDYGEYEEDYPRGIVFYTSTDGSEWKEVKAVGGELGYYSFSPMQAKYLRMVLTEDCSWNWSICEIKVWICAKQ